MEVLASLFVGNPLNIAVIALIVLAFHGMIRRFPVGTNRHPRALLVVAAAWGCYAAWEWLVVTRSPEANIRVDLLLIWPILAIITIWFAVRALR
jgi:hypothetical protein